MAIRTLALTFVALLCFSPQSYAQQCFPREKMLELLSRGHSESPVASGVTNYGGLIEVLKSTPGAEEDTWTIIITTPQGVSCLVAAGEGWTPVVQVSVDPEA